MQNRLSAALVASLFIIAPNLAQANADRGGSGLSQVEYAYSMPISDLLLGVHARYISDGAGGDSLHFTEFTPTLSKGFGGGFEASVALPFEGVTLPLDGNFDRRFDFRRADLTGKLRWTTDLGSPRLRFGMQGLASVPLDGLKKIRAGGTMKPDEAFDPGVQAMLSTNIGKFNTPVRLHLNAGYWFSRNDGAVYFRNHPAPLTLGQEIDNNNVVSGAAALEIGFRRFVAFTEVTTEQLVGARAQMRSKENLWRITPGFQTDLTSTIGLNASVSFDLSGDDNRTAFRPQDTYGDVEFRVGLNLGNVLSRNRYEGKKRDEKIKWKMQQTALAQAEIDARIAAEQLAAAEATANEEEKAALKARAEQTELARQEAAIAAAVEQALAKAGMSPEDRAKEKAEAEARMKAESELAAVRAEAKAKADAEKDEQEKAKVVEKQVVVAAPMAQGPAGTMAPAAATPDFQSELDKLRQDYERRIRDVELNSRFALLETRVGLVEHGGDRGGMMFVSPGGMPAMGRVEPSPASAEMSALVGQLMSRLDALEKGQTGPTQADPMVAAQAEIARLRQETAQLKSGAAAAAAAPAAKVDAPAPKGDTSSADQTNAQLMALMSRLTDAVETREAAPAAVSTNNAETEKMKRELDRLNSLVREVAAENQDEGTHEALAEVSRTLQGFLDDTPATTAAGSADSPLRVGSRQWYEGASANKIVSKWASVMKTDPTIKIAVVSHGGNAENRSQALRDTQDTAAAVRDALVAAGVRSDQVVAMGMGRAELTADSDPSGIEIERLR